MRDGPCVACGLYPLPPPPPLLFPHLVLQAKYDKVSKKCSSCGKGLTPAEEQAAPHQDGRCTSCEQLYEVRGKRREGKGKMGQQQQQQQLNGWEGHMGGESGGGTSKGQWQQCSKQCRAGGAMSQSNGEDD